VVNISLNIIWSDWTHLLPLSRTLILNVFIGSLNDARLADLPGVRRFLDNEAGVKPLDGPQPEREVSGARVDVNLAKKKRSGGGGVRGGEKVERGYSATTE
jgi:hypothetical protein